MNLRVEIRRNSDGVWSRDVWRDWAEWDGDYWWRDGNASCDCNRGDWWRRSMGLEPEEANCTDGRYSVRISNDDTGEILYNECATEAERQEVREIIEGAYFDLLWGDKGKWKP